MPLVEKSILINAPVGKVFAAHDDPRRVPEYMPGMVRVADIVRTRRRIGDSQRLTYSVLGLRFPTKMTIQEWEKDRRMVVKLGGGLNGTFTATYEPQGGATKASALEIVCRELDVPLADVMAMGDSESDLEMLRLAGLGIAVDNSPDEVKRAALHIAPANDADGVAWAIERFVL